MAAHAVLSASASERWLNCPGSVRLAAGLSSPPSVYALEGTAAHALAEHCLAHGYDADRFEGWAVDVREGSRTRFVQADEPGANMFPVTDEMVESVQVYLDLVRQFIRPGDEAEFEVRLDLSDIWPGMFGTADAVIYQPDTARLVVIDFKYGRGIPVEPRENTQMLYYALGAAWRAQNRGVDEVEIIVAQPRCPHPDGPVRRWTTDGMALLEYVGVLREKAAQTEAIDAPFKAGEWCRFCPASHLCPTLAAATFDAVEVERTNDGSPLLVEAEQMPPERIAAVLRDADMIETWLAAVRKFAHAEATQGRAVPGFKLVNKRAVRKWKDGDAARAALLLEHGLDEADVLQEPKMKSPAQVEKLFRGKAAKDALAPLWESVSSGTVLVPASDPRPEAGADLVFTDGA